MPSYSNSWPVGTVKIYSSPNSSSLLVGETNGLINADDGASANLNWIHVTHPYAGYADRKTVNTAYGDELSISYFGGSGTSNQLQQSSVKKIPVYNLQFALKRLGYSVGSVDGIFGSNTLSAVTSFQANNGLSSDGIVGDATKSRLISELRGLG